MEAKAGMLVTDQFWSSYCGYGILWELNELEIMFYDGSVIYIFLIDLSWNIALPICHVNILFLYL